MAYLVYFKKERKPFTDPIVNVFDARAYMSIDYSEHDTIISDMIDSATEKIETLTNRVIRHSNCEALWVQQGDGDLVSLTHCDNIELDSSISYEVVNDRIKTTDKEVFLKYSAGYISNAVPKWAIIAVKQDVAFMYEHRGDETIDKSLLSKSALETIKPHIYKPSLF